MILKIKNLHATIENRQILQGLNFEIKKGETHVIMGPNGSGKSTLSKILAGHPSYNIEAGSIDLCGQSLLSLPPELRAYKGLFLAFQHPMEISGVSNYDFLRIAYNAKQKFLEKKESNPVEFFKLIHNLAKKLSFSSEFLKRNLNEGFSGGEKKRNEILQMLLLKPKLIILDEIDSGLDIDALKIICKNINEHLPKNAAKLVVTHYSHLLNYLKPTAIHIMIEGKIVKSGGIELVEQVEKYGYENFN